MLLASKTMPPRPLNLSAPTAQQNLKIRQLLLASPLPSPSLPSILPRHGKKPPRINSRRIVRVLFWIAVLALLEQIYSRLTASERTTGLRIISTPVHLKDGGIAMDSSLPHFASPVAMIDRHGNRVWTISNPTNSGLLSPSTYAKLCARTEHLAAQVALTHHQHYTSVSDREIYLSDPNFVDVSEAKAAGLLPSIDDTQAPIAGIPTCTRSLTFSFDASTASLGPQLLQLWLSYSLAKREKRAFFIDDSRFPYGQFSTYFPEAAKPSCQRPHPSHIVPWPRQARHLVVSTATSEWMFGEAFQKHFSQRAIYDMMRHGFHHLWDGKLADQDDESYAQARVSELRAQASGKNALIAGLHIRRGNRRPLELQYRQSYIPLTRYISATTSPPDSPRHVDLIASSDDPTVYTNPDFVDSSITRAQYRISLASKADSGQDGWDGGFFSGIFWSLGGGPESEARKHHFAYQNVPGAAQPSKKQFHKSEPDGKRQDSDALQLREYVARAYLLDLAILARASDTVVCTADSSACAILGVMLGWERVKEGDWINVDYGAKPGTGGVEWRGLDDVRERGMVV